MAFSLELSDGLTHLAADLDQFIHGGIVMDGETVARLVDHVRKLKRRARDLENEVSRTRWNRLAARDRGVETDAVLTEICRPGTNLALFPVVPRPFSDGQPRGSA